jgi:hypothetical protein
MLVVVRVLLVLLRSSLELLATKFQPRGGGAGGRHIRAVRGMEHCHDAGEALGCRCSVV